MHQSIRSRAHILDGDHANPDQESGGHWFDAGVPNKTVFPEGWGPDRVINEIEDVARNPDAPPVYNEERDNWVVSGTRDGVDIEVVVRPDGEVVTGYPTGGRGVERTDENGDPHPIP